VTLPRLLAPALLGGALNLVAACGGAPSPETAPGPVESRDATIEHTVREGETLARIADIYYGDPAQADRIAADNGVTDPARLAAGSVLRLRFDDASYERARRRAAALEPYNRGVEAMSRGDLDEAERQFRLALRTVPDLADARYNLALVLMKRGQNEAASDLLGALVAERPQDPEFGFALGNALFRQTRFVEAARAFDRVLAVAPDHRRAAFGHARALQESGARAEAIAAWQRYLELDPASSWAAEARRHLAELRGD
jgi:tetratricopeptide (TPR) repeat protein